MSTIKNKEIIGRRNKQNKKLAFQRKLNDRKKNKRILSSKNLPASEKENINISKNNEVNPGLNIGDRKSKKIYRKLMRAKIKRIDYTPKRGDYAKIKKGLI